MYESTIAGVPAGPKPCERTQPNRSLSRRTSFWPPQAPPSKRCWKRPAPCRSYSRVSPTRVAAGYVENLARPGRNATGFTVFEYSIAGKWLELLKEIAPRAPRRPTANRNLIIALAAKHRLPAVYSARFYAVAGGLIAYGLDFLDQSRRAAGYVDRTLKGEKPADLPVQHP